MTARRSEELIRPTGYPAAVPDGQYYLDNERVRSFIDTDAEFGELFQSHYTNVRCEATKPPGETAYDHGHGH